MTTMNKKTKHWVGGLGLLLAVSFGSAVTAHAQTFTTCVPSEFDWNTLPAVDQPAAKVAAQKACDAENVTYATWQKKLEALSLAETYIRQDGEKGDYKAAKAVFDEVAPVLTELKQQADAHLDANGAQNMRDLFGTGLGMVFQNAGLSAPGPGDLTAQVNALFDDHAQQTKAVSVASSLVYQARVRGSDFIVGLARSAKETVAKQRLAELDQRAAQKRDQLYGGSASGYFGGFGTRIAGVYAPFFLFLFLAAIVGAMFARRARLDPFTSAVKAATAALLPAACMAVVLIVLPFVPTWLIFALTTAATAALFTRGAPILNALAERVPVLGPWLRFMAGFLGALSREQAFAPATVPAGAAASPAPAGAMENVVAQNTHGSSRWGTPAEMIAGRHLVKSGELPDGKTAGLALARAPLAPVGVDARFRYIGHIVTVAPNGSGKGIGAVIPNLLEYPGSCLVLDVKGENTAVTARRRREMGQRVFVVDPFNVTGQPSNCFNLLDRLDVTDPNCVSESAGIADSLVIPEKPGETNHFDETAKNLLQGLMLHVAGSDDPARRNLPEVRRLLTANEETLEATLAEMAADESAAFGIPARAANTLLGTADRERGSILSTARKNTAFLDDPRIAAALLHSDFDLAEIKGDPMTVYLVMPANRIGPNARFVRGFIDSVIAAVTSSAKQPPHRVAFLLDEFAQLGYMKAIEDAVSLMRGYGLAFWVFLQDLSQLKGVYPRWQTFMANSAKVFFGTDDYDTAKYVSDSLGKATIEFETTNEGQNRGANMHAGGAGMNRGKSSGTSQQFAGRELLTPDEVMRLGPERPIVIVKGEYPYQLARLNYLADREYAGQADPNPYHA
ncbi:conjugal transfer coupling protein TraG [Burkholderia arboris]|uniref:Conjugal transfer coupling protein TraG n=1 Tax=Burkholderia arboris TaxID=488730 RepID=A0A9Q9SRP7_9BURK|nr:type IV secretory system conjugative DNA transfer family protein [Burkholderia arboris]VWC46024.1 conjugal transfer coupling protein TraG [Burkholderia arboris]